MNIKTGNKQTYKNLALNIFAFFIQFITSFYLSPIIVSNVGTSANGFIGLANDLVSYATIVASVFNAAAARFITDAMIKGDKEKANGYFNSLISTNIILAGIFGLIGMILVPNINAIFNVPKNLLIDVKLTFAIIFLSYIITLVTQVFTVSTYVVNRSDIQGVRNIISYIVRFALIIVFLNFVSISIYWVSLASLVATIVVAILNISLTKKLTPELVIDIHKSDKKYIKELASAGVWMGLTSISTLLLRGLDLAIANVVLGDYEMGLLSIARTFPNNITSIITTIAPIYAPVFIAFYAKDNFKELIVKIKGSIRTSAIIMFVPITGFIVYSGDFYSLWQKSLSEKEVAIISALSIITVIQAYFNTSTATLAQLSVVTNKLWRAGVASLTCGVLSILIEFVLLYTTNLGVYAIVVSTTIVMVLRYILFNPIYASFCLEQKRTLFYGDVIKTWCIIPALYIVMVFVKHVLPVSSWITLLVSASVSAVIGYVISVLLLDPRILDKFTKKQEK